MGKLPPLAMIQLCNRQLGDWLKDHLLQHGDDLDFVQDVLTATDGNPELNPILNGVLDAFSRRKRFGRFKCGQLNLEFDRLRHANTITPKDNDLEAKDMKQKSGEQDGFKSCNFFQRKTGCNYGKRCRFQHECVICGSTTHGAIKCEKRGQQESEPGLTTTNPRQGRERPPDPRMRRSRAQ